MQEKQAYESEGLWNQWYVAGYIEGKGKYTLKEFFFNWMLYDLFNILVFNVSFEGLWNIVNSCSRDSTYISLDLSVIYVHKFDISVKQISSKKVEESVCRTTSAVE